MRIGWSRVEALCEVFIKVGVLNGRIHSQKVITTQAAWHDQKNDSLVPNKLKS